MLTVFGALAIGAALFTVYLLISASRQPDASRLVHWLAEGTAAALFIVVVLSIGVGALIQAAALGGTAMSVATSGAALLLPVVGFYALLKVRPLPLPLTERAANTAEAPVRHGLTGRRLASEAEATLTAVRQAV